MTIWITGKNMPGYLPETDPWPSESESAARADLVQDLEYDWDSHAQGDCPEDCEVCGEYLQAHTELHNGTQTVYVDGLVYWIVQAEPLTDGQARRIASDWHGGQWSKLYSLASTGSTEDDNGSTDALLGEIDRELGNATEGQAELAQLGDYVRQAGARGPVPGWANLWT